MRASMCIAVLLSSSAAAVQAQTYGSGQPNLVVDANRLGASVLFRSSRFTARSCALVEGSVGNEISPLPARLPWYGVRRALMRFDVEIMNYADTDLVVGAPGDPALYEFSPCHGHYHLRGFTNYELLALDGTLVITGRKQAFCLMDTERWDPAAGPAKYTCGDQGISAGWADVYDRSLDGQWLDVTGVRPGRYLLRVSVDFGNLFPEADENDNSATVMVTIPNRIR
jgi:hypothetical protein